MKNSLPGSRGKNGRGKIEDGSLNYKGIINDNRTILIKGVRLFQEKNVDIVDALVHTTSKENN